MKDLRRIIHPEGLCHGLNRPQIAYETTMKWLREIIFQDPIPQAEQLANAAGEFSLRYMLPIPHRHAVLALSAKNGWSKEGLLQGLLVNMGWLEHHSTRIVDAPGAVHRRAATIAAFFAGPPSTRKSSMRDFIARYCLAVPGMPTFIAEGRTLCTDATVKRSSLLSGGASQSRY